MIVTELFQGFLQTVESLVPDRRLARGWASVRDITVELEMVAPPPRQFFDLAAAEKGRIPEDLQTEEVLDKLPILFRTLRGQKVPDDKLDELVDLVRGKRKR